MQPNANNYLPKIFIGCKRNILWDRQKERYKEIFLQVICTL